MRVLVIKTFAATRYVIRFDRPQLVRVARGVYTLAQLTGSDLATSIGEDGEP